jgi:hypothetical protein
MLHTLNAGGAGNISDELNLFQFIFALPKKLFLTGFA